MLFAPEGSESPNGERLPKGSFIRELHCNVRDNGTTKKIFWDKV